jgi:hypothetical protein
MTQETAALRMERDIEAMGIRGCRLEAGTQGIDSGDSWRLHIPGGQIATGKLTEFRACIADSVDLLSLQAALTRRDLISA